MRVERTLPPIGGVTGFGMNLGRVWVAKIPCGMFVSVMLTGELKVPMEITVTVTFPHWPWLIITIVGLTVTVKSEVAITVSVTIML